MTSPKRNILIKIVLEIARLVLGSTFLFSGFVKAVDPLGTAYKIEDYLTFMHLVSFHPLALPASIGMCALEFLLGAWLLLGLYRRIVTKLLFAVMLFMTPLTLYLAIKNPVHDCGCFGDAIILTNWETFYKNLILLPLSIIVMIWHNRITSIFSRHTYWLATLFSTGFILTFTLINYFSLPIFDFRPYKIGTNLKKLVAQKEEGAKYKNIFIYEKNGKQKKFTEDNYPWQDPTWKFVKMKTEQVSQGKETGVEDFSITKQEISTNRKDIEGETDITKDVLNDTNYTFLMTAYTLKTMDPTHLSDFEDVSYYAQENGYNFYCLTSSNQKDILHWIDESGVNYNFCMTDERTIKTMIRSNPGLILMRDGKIINKWPGNNIPQEGELNKPLDKLSFSKSVHRNWTNKNKMLILCVIFVSPLLLLLIFDLPVYRWKQKKSKKKTPEVTEQKD